MPGMPLARAILFTDLVGSTELLTRIGQEAMERVRREHFALMREAIAEQRGTEVKTVGDAFMVAFDTATAAVASAVGMQVRQRTRGREQKANGVQMRAGISFGEVDEDAGDYFGIPVVEASRLCAKAEGGQVLAADVVRMLARGSTVQFKSVGALELKGLQEPVPASEVLYELPKEEPFLARTPFVGRGAEVAKLRAKLEAARQGQGGLVMLVGEPGIGKTRTIEEFCAESRDSGATVIVGRCFEGDWAPPYGPFSEALAELAHIARPEELRADMGFGAAPLARLVPAIRDVLPDLPEPAALAPNEEQFRILDAVSQLLLAQSKRAPLLLVLDDLHWADAGTLAMLRHVARFVRQGRILILGAYRDVELDRQHPLAEALSALRREVEYERLLLKGLGEGEVGELLEAIAEHEAAPAFVHAISQETDGNPFFIREVLLHLVEEGKLVRVDGRWTSSLTVAEMSIPEGVRQVIGRRVSRLSPAANRLLSTASAFNGPFRFAVAGAAAVLADAEALDAIDEALDAQLIVAGTDPETYAFAHALIRHTLYAEMNPSRQVRLHRQLAEAMEQTLGARAGDHAAEIAYQYHRSAALPGSERGVVHALAAADRAEAAYAWDQAVSYLKMALELMEKDDPQRLATLGRLGLALPFIGAFDEAEALARDVAVQLAARDGHGAAYRYLWSVANNCFQSGAPMATRRLASFGVQFVGDERDAVALNLLTWDLNYREEQHPDYIGIYLDSPERRALQAAALSLPAGQAVFSPAEFETAAAAKASAPTAANPGATLLFWAGDFRGALPPFQDQIALFDAEGRLDWAATNRTWAAACCIALGELDRGHAILDEAAAMSGRFPRGVSPLQVWARQVELCSATDDDWESVVPWVERFLAGVQPQDLVFAAPVLGAAAMTFARLGQGDRALQLIARVLPAVEQASKWAGNYPRLVCEPAAALWFLGRSDQAEALERNIREKVVEPDFGYPMVDGRLSLARLCSLQGRLDEARDWFAESRKVLEEQGARPLRAICDYDEALALVRHEARGMRDEGFPADVRAEAEALLTAAIAQFREIGMIGWTRRAEALLAGGSGP